MRVFLIYGFNVEAAMRKGVRFSAAFFLIFLAAAIFTGCAPAVTLTPVAPLKADGFSPFESGAVKTKSVGEVMVMYNLLVNVEAYQGFVATEDFKLPAPAGQTYPVVEKDSEWKAFAKTEDGSLVAKNIAKRMSPVYANPVSGQTMEMPREVCLLVNPAGEPYGAVTYVRCRTPGYENETYGSERYMRCAVNSNDRAFFVVNPDKIIWDNKPKNFLKPTTIFHGKKSGKIIYLGKTSTAIRILYQATGESDLELSYDIQESNVIAVKDITFEILEATNVSITYVVKTGPDALKARIIERERDSKGGNSPAAHEI